MRRRSTRRRSERVGCSRRRMRITSPATRCAYDIRTAVYVYMVDWTILRVYRHLRADLASLSLSLLRFLLSCTGSTRSQTCRCRRRRSTAARAARCAHIDPCCRFPTPQPRAPHHHHQVQEFLAARGELTLAQVTRPLSKLRSASILRSFSDSLSDPSTER